MKEEIDQRILKLQGLNKEALLSNCFPTVVYRKILEDPSLFFGYKISRKFK